MAFVYTTRGNSSPQGKPRVCFLSHKEDFAAYFDQLSKEILELQNCSIWHVAAESAGGADTADSDTVGAAGVDTADAFDLAELDQMQLIVIPVTRKLLASENEILERVLPYAIEKNIPVLPIIVEGGLDAPFAEKIGDLEYLDKTAIDPTAIPYKERLGKFLSSVLLNDTQIEEIRSAFDAYIFLSYRKKDRAYANELMHLIHQNEFSEKVAIWYDEFLVPGENFNDAIEEALKKSNLFSLVVTPNLVNEKNYVMEIEYPMAQKNHKTILPIEMVATEHDALKQYYEGIPNPVNSQNPEQIANALRDYLPIATSSKADPVHDFFVGLAYLSGIDVEVDRERALKLITSSANAGVDLAMKKLSSMYAKGDGVERDIKKAEEWQGRLVIELSDTAEESRSEDDAFDFLREAKELAELAIAAEDFEMADDTCTTMFDIAQRLSFGSLEKSIFGKMKSVLKKYTRTNPRLQEGLTYMWQACRMMLDVAFGAGISEKIFEWSKKANGLRTVIGFMDGPEIGKELMRLCGRMATECTESGNLNGAKEWLGSAFSYFESLDKDNLSTEVKYNYSFLMDAASDFEIASGELKEAYGWLQDRKALLRPLQDEFPDNLQIRYEIIKIWLKQADIAYQFGDLEELQSCAAKAKELIDAEEMETDEVKLLLAEYYQQVGSAAAAGKEYDQAITLLKQSVDILTPMLDRLFDADHLREAATSEERLGDCYYFMQQYQEAYDWHLKASQSMDAVMTFSKLLKDVRISARLYEDLLYDAGQLKNILKIQEWNELALWTRNVLVTGIALPKVGIRREKKIADLVEKGKYESPQYLKDKEALENLLGKQDAIKETIDHGVIPLENSLIAYVQSQEARAAGVDFSVIKQEFAELISKFLDTHVVAAIRDDLIDLRFILLGKKDASTIGNPVRKIQSYILEQYVPFFKYDEKAMLLLSLCDYSLSSTKEFLRDYPEIVYWKYPMDEIKYPKLWSQLYNLQEG